MQERRRAPRIEAHLKLELRLPGRQVATLGETLNISSNGVYFRTEYFMAESTKLPIIIHLPAAAGAAAALLRPEGIVVRCIPEEEDPSVDTYEVACFFLEIAENDQQKLNQFLAERMRAANPG